MEVIDFGIVEYNDILETQKRLFDRLVTAKSINGEKGEEFILIGEHYPVITLGRRANEENILVDENILKEKDINVYHVGRGGDVTFHAPGQLIVYSILDLEQHRLGVKEYVALLEECVIILLQNYGIRGERIHGATGVWIGKNTSNERKICAIGIKCRKFCTMHGIALNVNTDLSGFTLINPCGFQDKGVTSLKEELRKEVEMSRVKREFLEIFQSRFFKHLPQPHILVRENS